MSTKIVRPVICALALTGLLAGCGNNMEQRVASGALIGATGGAVLAGSVGGAALGALAGAGAGAVVNETQKDKKKR